MIIRRARFLLTIFLSPEIHWDKQEDRVIVCFLSLFPGRFPDTPTAPARPAALRPFLDLCYA